MCANPQIGGCTLQSFAGIGKGDESKHALARAAVKNATVLNPKCLTHKP